MREQTETIENLNEQVSNLNRDLQKEMLTNAKSLEELNTKHTAETMDLKNIIANNEESISLKDCKINELERNIENLKEDLDDHKVSLSNMTTEKIEVNEKYEKTSLQLSEVSGALQLR